MATFDRALTFLCTFSFRKISVASRRCWFSKILRLQSTQSSCFMQREILLFRIPSQEGKVQQYRNPVTINQKENCEEGMNGSLGDDVGVEAVAEVNGIDIVTEIAISIHCLPSQLARSILCR